MSAEPPMVKVAGRLYTATLSTPEAARFFDCSPQRLQQGRGSGLLPVEPLQLGNRLRWPTVKIAAAVGIPAEIVWPDEHDPVLKGAA